MKGKRFSDKVDFLTSEIMESTVHIVSLFGLLSAPAATGLMFAAIIYAGMMEQGSSQALSVAVAAFLFIAAEAGGLLSSHKTVSSFAKWRKKEIDIGELLFALVLLSAYTITGIWAVWNFESDSTQLALPATLGYVFNIIANGAVASHLESKRSQLAREHKLAEAKLAEREAREHKLAEAKLAQELKLNEAKLAQELEQAAKLGRQELKLARARQAAELELAASKQAAELELAKQAAELEQQSELSKQEKQLSYALRKLPSEHRPRPAQRSPVSANGSAGDGLRADGRYDCEYGCGHEPFNNKKQRGGHYPHCPERKKKMEMI